MTYLAHFMAPIMLDEIYIVSICQIQFQDNCQYTAIKRHYTVFSQIKCLYRE